MPVIPFNGIYPKIAGSCWIAPDAWVTGDTTIGEDVSVFFGAVLRGDILPVSVGKGTNLQEGVLLHTSHELTPCIVGSNVTVGHHAIVHGCTVGDACIIGMGATLLDGAEIGKHCIIGANSLVTMNTKIPEGSLALGSPAKVVRMLRPEEIEGIYRSARDYVETGRAYNRQLS